MTYPEGQPRRLAEGARSLGMDPASLDPYPRLDLPAERRAEARARVRSLGRRVIGVQVGSGPVNVAWRRRPDVKGLAAEPWAGLLTGVLSAGEADAAVFTGTARERRAIESVIRRVPDPWRRRLHNLAGTLRLDETVALVGVLDAFVSVDTGPAHVAAAVGCPLLVIFGPTDPAAYLMRGSAPVEMVLGSAPCQFCNGTRRFKTCRDNRCLNTLTADDLLRGWRRLTASRNLDDQTPGPEGHPDPEHRTA
jgi:ADP-heptose:LPS heptosyltransferase